MNTDRKLLTALYSISLTTGLIWARSSYGKFASGVFADNLGKTLSKTVQTNPYSFYKDFLQSFAIPNSFLFGQMVLWGEILVAASLVFSTIYLLFKNPNEYYAKIVLALGLFGGAFLNINFWLAFSAGNAAADSLNIYMAVIQFISAIYIISTLKRG